MRCFVWAGCTVGENALITDIVLAKRTPGTMSADHTFIVNMCQFAVDGRSSKKRWIPADLVQNTAEYLARVAGFLSFRGVSITWQGAVSDAVGFLNGRCWTRLNIHSPLLALYASMMVPRPIGARCCAWDLGSRRWEAISLSRRDFLAKRTMR
jgi:hypothetical protein